MEAIGWPGRELAGGLSVHSCVCVYTSFESVSFLYVPYKEKECAFG